MSRADAREGAAGTRKASVTKYWKEKEETKCPGLPEKEEATCFGENVSSDAVDAEISTASRIVFWFIFVMVVLGPAFGFYLSARREPESRFFLPVKSGSNFFVGPNL